MPDRNIRTNFECCQNQEKLTLQIKNSDCGQSESYFVAMNPFFEEVGVI